jgi:hypothetical protein
VWDDDEVIYGIESESYGVEWFAGWYLNPELHNQKAEGGRQKAASRRQSAAEYAHCLLLSVFCLLILSAPG